MNLLELLGILLGICLVAHGLYTWYLTLFTPKTFASIVSSSFLNVATMGVTVLVFYIIAFYTIVVLFKYLATIQLW